MKRGLLLLSASLLIVACSSSSSHDQSDPPCVAEGLPCGSGSVNPCCNGRQCVGGYCLAAKDASVRDLAAADSSRYQGNFTLTPLLFESQTSSSIKVYFSVTDERGAGVPDLAVEDFVLTEDGQPLSKSESSFVVRKRDTQQNLKLPTVLLLDLSKSVIDANALATVKEAARKLVEGMQPEQSMQLVTFADQLKVRQTFTSVKSELTTAIDAISQADGVSTNLYGSVLQCLEMWKDGFAQQLPAGDAGVSQLLTVGLLFVITDGDDTAGVAKLQDVLDARKNKRVMTIGVGQDTNTAALTALGNFGYIQSRGFDELAKDAAAAVASIQTINDSIYFTGYCSPKRSGTHTLEIMPKHNQGVPYCAWATFSMTLRCEEASALRCSSQHCCAVDIPFACQATGLCFATAAEAAESCKSAPAPCEECGGDGKGTGPGPVLSQPFQATGFGSGICTP